MSVHHYDVAAAAAAATRAQRRLRGQRTVSPAEASAFHRAIIRTDDLRFVWLSKFHTVLHLFISIDLPSPSEIIQNGMMSESACK
jgi:hypothetical protein